MHLSCIHDCFFRSAFQVMLLLRFTVRRKLCTVSTDLQTRLRQGNVPRSNTLIASELIFKYYYGEHLWSRKDFCCEQTETTVEMSSGVLEGCDAETASKPHDGLPDGFSRPTSPHLHPKQLQMTVYLEKRGSSHIKTSQASAWSDSSHRLCTDATAGKLGKSDAIYL